METTHFSHLFSPGYGMIEPVAVCGTRGACRTEHNAIPGQAAVRNIPEHRAPAGRNTTTFQVRQRRVILRNIRRLPGGTQLHSRTGSGA